MLLLNTMQSKLIVTEVFFHKTNVIFGYSTFSSHAGAKSGVARQTSANIKRKHLFAPSIKASFSVEASVTLPILVCAVVFVLMFFRILSIQWGISVGSIDLARSLAVIGDSEMSEPYLTEGGVGKGGLMATMQAKIISEKVPVKFITQGAFGIDFTESDISKKDIDIIANYEVNSPVNLLGYLGFDITQRTRVHRWVGYDPKEESEDNETVYVTRTGTAYHRNIDCTYLSPSVKVVSSVDIKEMRNAGGAKYYPCERCKDKAAGMYYITDYGTAYHISASCTALERSLLRKKLIDAQNGGYHACHKCG